MGAGGAGGPGSDAEPANSAPAPSPWPGMSLGRELAAFLTPRSLIVGIGNVDRGDDGFGPVVVEQLRRLGFHQVLDAGTAPENYAHKLADSGADSILLVDTALMHRRPGQLALLDPDRLGGGGVDTHTGGLWLLSDYLRDVAGVKCGLLAAEPLRPAGGWNAGPMGLSLPLRRAARRATRLIGLALGRSTAPHTAAGASGSHFRGPQR